MKQSKLARVISVAFVLGCILPGDNGLFFRQAVVWGLFLFGWVCFFVIIAFHRSHTKTEQSVELVNGALTSNWVCMHNVSYITSAVMHRLIDFSPEFLST